MEGRRPFPVSGTLFPDDAQLYSPHLLHFPYQLTFSSKGQPSQSRVASGTNSGASSGLLASPKTAVLWGSTRAKQGGSGRLPAFPFNGNYALFASLQKGVSRGQRVREGGPPRREGAGGRGADCQRQLLGLKDTLGKTRSLQNLDFYLKLEAPGLLSSHLP